MHKANSDVEQPNNDDAVKLKASISSKNAEIKTLVEAKVTLVNLLKEAQEKLNNGGNGTESVDKCIKLTNDLKCKSNMLKATEKERNELKETQSKQQREINSTNNKIAHLEAENVKLNDFNNKMYDICKKSGVFEKLESNNVKEMEDQKHIYVDNSKGTKDTKDVRATRYGNKPPGAQKEKQNEVKEHCWYYENGFCRKGGRCPFSHPAVTCIAFWNTGECSQSGSCPNRHPVQVCIRYLKGTCFAGRNCVHQHPVNQNGVYKTQIKNIKIAPTQRATAMYQHRCLNVHHLTF